jgi:hypothetical protein
MYRFLSRNEYRGTYAITEEEKLLEVIDELKDYLEINLRTATPSIDEDEPKHLYPTFDMELATKSKTFIGEGDYRRICCIPRFFLGLVMLSRIQRHYTHAQWFRIPQLGEMLNVHGGVCLALCT